MVSKDLDTVAAFNLSAGGIFFYSRTNLEVGTILYLKIGFSNYYPTKICVGKVIRAKRYQAISIYGYSVEFTEIDEQTRKMINKNLEITELHQKLK
jgi:nitric oxide synthase oxygenase domain/subunit